MKSKNNSTIHIVLISLFASMVINYYVSLLYKVTLLTQLGAQVYYQFITWLSLAQPVLITLAYNYIRKSHYKRKKEKFLKKTINSDILPEDTKEKLDALRNDAVSIKNTIEELYDEQ